MSATQRLLDTEGRPGKDKAWRAGWGFDDELSNPPDRLLECMAGFYRSGLAARAAALRLQKGVGLQASQLTLLAPADSGRLRFARRARGWAPDRAPDQCFQRGDGWLAGVVGALLAGLAVVAWLTTTQAQPEDWPRLAIPLALLAGALLGAGTVILLGWLRAPQRFDATVRHQLHLGCWALVACRVPWASQAGVVHLLRSSSDQWCAVAPRAQRL